MAGFISVSRGAAGAKSVTISVGSGWYTMVVDGARKYFAPEELVYINMIYGEGDDGIGDWVDLRDAPPQAFNAFYRAIRKSIEVQVKILFDDAGKSRPNPVGTETDQEIVEKLEADPRFQP